MGLIKCVFLFDDRKKIKNFLAGLAGIVILLFPFGAVPEGQTKGEKSYYLKVF
jgi:hypothetical protein